MAGQFVDQSRQIYVKILEQPAPKALRFRYECEGRSAGSLPGIHSSGERKSFPKIQIVGYKGRAVVVVSCVTVDPPYRPHPHNLVGKEGCKKGVCTMEIGNDDMTCEFSNLGIQCVKKKDIEDSLRIREEIRVDPFRTGFSHKSQPGSIDLNSVRLCFQVFLEGPERGQFKLPLKAVVSDPIYDKKAINDLTIMKMSDCSSPVMGNKEVILLCDKVSKDDIEVRFYEETPDGAVNWEAFGDFQPSDVHKQFAICFRTPQYHTLEIENPARVYIQLRCPSKDTTSAPRPFEYQPLTSDIEVLRRKRQKLMTDTGTQRLNQYFQADGPNVGLVKRTRVSSFPPIPSSVATSSTAMAGNMSPMYTPAVKQEPPDDFYTGHHQSYMPFLGFSGGGVLQQSGNVMQAIVAGSNMMQQQPSSGMVVSTGPTVVPSSSSGMLQQVGSIPGLPYGHRPSTTPSPLGLQPMGVAVATPVQLPSPVPVPAATPVQTPTTVETTVGDLVDQGNISLPNLSDINLSLLESNLSDHFNSNLSLFERTGLGGPIANDLDFQDLNSIMVSSQSRPS